MREFNPPNPQTLPLTPLVLPNLEQLPSRISFDSVSSTIEPYSAALLFALDILPFLLHKQYSNPSKSNPKAITPETIPAIAGPEKREEGVGYIGAAGTDVGLARVEVAV